jgi:hypothetical protein
MPSAPKPETKDEKPSLTAVENAALAAEAKEKQAAEEAKAKQAADAQKAKQADGEKNEAAKGEETKEAVIEEQAAPVDAPARGTRDAAAAVLAELPDDPRQPGAKIVDRPMTVGAR